MRGLCVYGAHRYTLTFINWLINQALRTERLPVTIWKKFRMNIGARFWGLWSVLSVTQQSGSFGGACGSSPKVDTLLVVTASTWGTCVIGVVTMLRVSFQLGIGRMAVCGLKRTRFAVGWVPSIRCSRAVAAAPSTIAILVFQRGLGRRYIRGER